jgi:hypothetical protein
MLGQQCCGVGVDCVRFVAAVMDELHHTVNGPGIRLPYDTSLHNRAGAIKVVHYFVNRYDPLIVRKQDGVYRVQPGDVAVVKIGRNPGHVFVIGPDENTAWHASENVGVRMTGISQIKNLIRVYRPRSEWLHF